MAEALLYEIRCIFCRSVHRSPFFDELEEGVLRCRDTAREENQGRMATFDFDAMHTVRVESEAYAAASNAEDPFRLGMTNDGGP